MDRTKLKAYAPQARRDFIKAVTARAAYHGLTATKVEPIIVQGEVMLIGGKPFPRAMARKRKALEERIARQGFEQTMEAMAYTWFNRFAAIRFMELHGYLEHGYRVLSNLDPEKSTPEILEHAEHVDLPGLNQTTVIDLKLDGTREAELYRMLLMAQCNALHAAMPFLFERIDDETELLLPDNLLHSDSLIRKLVNEIDEADWQEVEIIGWLYQFYVSEKKDQVIGKVVKSEDIPAATQLFTPNWIVKYLVQNSLGRQWMATYPNSLLKQQMEYYIEPAEQTPEVHAQLKAITPESLNPEELTLLDPACGSGHILVEAYDLFKAIYQERGYRARDIPSLILQKNLYGLEIDDRAAQLAAFALMMKARADDRRIFSSGMQPHVLAIQESKGLDAQQVTEAINVPLDTGEKQGQKGNIAQTDVAQLLALFEYGKTFGSLIRVPGELVEKLSTIAERVDEVLEHGDLLNQVVAKFLLPLIKQSQLLAHRYNTVLANPPYMGGKAMNTVLKAFAGKYFPDRKADTFAMFIERSSQLTKDAGYMGFVTPFVWMFLSSYEKLREYIFTKKTILSLVKPSYTSFFESAIVPLVTFVMRMGIESVKGDYCDLGYLGSAESQPIKLKEAIRDPNCAWRYCATKQDFKKIPGTPLAYWVSDKVRALFKHRPIGSIATATHGMSTSDNDRFLRMWYEVDFSAIGWGFKNRGSAKTSGLKWFPFNKGGSFRRWYGNNEYLVNWQDDGREIKEISNQKYPYLKGNLDFVIGGQIYYFRPGITWSSISSSSPSFRWFSNGFVIGNKGQSLYLNDIDQTFSVLAFLNSSISSKLLGILSPTIGFELGYVIKLPVVVLSGDIAHNAQDLVDIYKKDWDTQEQSCEFAGSPLCNPERSRSILQLDYDRFCEEQLSLRGKARMLEETNNLAFVRACDIDGEVPCDVPEDEITLYRPNREEDIKRLISYAIGCMMGRYSLDEPGLIYAHSSNKHFDPSQYQTFPADDDGIIPMMETDWFPDDASNRLVEFINVAWPKEHLAENLTFIADSLGPNRNEQPRDTIRRYFATGFYKHHLSMYKRRPIYWLFCSGKQRAFQCLVYLHRYHEGTLSRMRTEYVIPLQGKIASRLDQLADDIAAASSTAHRKRLEKERDTLRKQHTELQAFDEQLRHYADQRISLDLDDGVKVNYGKFGDLLAEVKAVTGGIEET